MAVHRGKRAMLKLRMQMRVLIRLSWVRAQLRDLLSHRNDLRREPASRRKGSQLLIPTVANVNAVHRLP